MSYDWVTPPSFSPDTDLPATSLMELSQDLNMLANPPAGRIYASTAGQSIPGDGSNNPITMPSDDWLFNGMAFGEFGLQVPIPGLYFVAAQVLLSPFTAAGQVFIGLDVNSTGDSPLAGDDQTWVVGQSGSLLLVDHIVLNEGDNIIPMITQTTGAACTVAIGGPGGTSSYLTAVWRGFAD